MQSWLERQANLTHIASRRQLFFVDGQPRSGTTWLQQLLDGHPDVCCRGEASFRDHLEAPLEQLMRQRRQELQNRNTAIFRHTGGYPPPAPEDTDMLLGTGILLALHQQSLETGCTAIGEKTPGNIFLFPRIKTLFPTAKLITIARDPRDVITSNWHRFQANPGSTEAAKIDFIRQILPVAGNWMRTMLAFRERFPAHCMIVTYEQLQRAPAAVLARLFRFLDVSDRPDIVADCVERSTFERLTGGRPAGVEQVGSFYRKGIVGDWTTTLTPAMNEMVLHELGWSFPSFGWNAEPPCPG